MKFVAVLLMLCSSQCLAQQSYDALLSLRLEQIGKLSSYNNKIVTHNDSIEYHDMDYPYWKPHDTYYKDDVVKYKHCYYAAKKNTKTEKPGTSPAVWGLIRGPHPYLFLRDTAKAEDLNKLLSDGHPYIRIYAFAALSFRKQGNLFSVIIDNMKDTTEVTAHTGDTHEKTYPAELMILYEACCLDRNEKRRLIELIATKYSHLKDCNRYLD